MKKNHIRSNEGFFPSKELKLLILTYNQLIPGLLLAMLWGVLSNVGAGDAIRGLRSLGWQAAAAARQALIVTHAELLRVGPSGPEIGYSMFSALYKYLE